MSGPSIEQLRILANRAARQPLNHAEVARLHAGIDALAAESAAARPSRAGGARRRLKNLKARLMRLHAPMWRGGIEICRECSGWDGFRCRGLVTPYPCPTVDAIDTRPEPASGPQAPVGAADDAREGRGATRAAQRGSGGSRVAAA